MGFATSFIAGGGLFLILAMQVGFGFMGILPLGLVVLLLATWPLLLRRFFQERHFNLMLAGDQAPLVRRAPDTGLTTLGWLLIATSVSSVAIELASFVSSPTLAGGNMFMMMASPDSLGATGLDRYLPLLMGAAALWAGIELVTMSARHRLAATVYGVLGSVGTVFLHWQLFRSFDGVSGLLGVSGGGPLESFQEMLPVVMALVIPVGTLALVHRRQLDGARALQRPAG
jgi:hypothetical protein